MDANAFYGCGDIRIVNGDSRAVQVARGDVLTVTDPPYNVGYAYDGYTDRLPEGEYRELLRATIHPPCVLIHYIEGVFTLAEVLGMMPSRVVAWIYHANTFRQWRAVAWFGVKPDFELDGQEYRNPSDRRIAARMANGEQARLYDWWHIEQVKNVSAEKTGHPCQVPLSLVQRILRITPEPPMVYDPFMGSGTVLVAAQSQGRPGLGVERSEQYCAIARDRLAQPALVLCS